MLETVISVYLSAWGDASSTSTNEVAQQLDSELRRRGIPIVDSPDLASHLVVVEHVASSSQKLGKHFNFENRLLVVVEPSMVNPTEYNLKTRQLYSRCLVVSPDFKVLSTDLVWQYGHLPPDYANGIPRDWLSRSRQVAVVNENKFSLISSSRYKARKNYIEHLCRTGVDVHLGGKNWSRGLAWHFAKQGHAVLLAILANRLPNFSQIQRPLKKFTNLTHYGRVESQIIFLDHAKYALVVENEKTYLSEKLFDAIRAGCVPIYDGPDLMGYGIPENIYLTFSEFINRNGALESYAVEDSKRQKAGQTWLRLPETAERWLISRGVERLADQICDWLDSSVNGPEPG